MKKIKSLSIALFCTLCVIGQTFEIPEGKFELYWEDFIGDCRKATSELPFKVKASINTCMARMEHGNLFGHVAVPFILDGDTTLLSYIRIDRNEDTGEIYNKSYTWFDFDAVGFFEYKNYWVVVYSYPLGDPNKYHSYTINTYTKDGKRIDRLPFFKWECGYISIIDISCFEITGYIDEEFEITVQTRDSWSEEMTWGDEEEASEQNEKQSYKVYHINDEGKFEEVDKKPKYVVDDKNNWKQNK